MSIAPLARANPTQWRIFLEAFHDYENAAKDRLVAASSDSLACAQGEARAIGLLSKLFNEAVKTSDRVAKLR